MATDRINEDYRIEITREEYKEEFNYWVKLFVEWDSKVERKVKADFVDQHYVISVNDHRTFPCYNIETEIKGVVDEKKDLEDRMYQIAKEEALTLLDYDYEMYGTWTEDCIDDQVRVN